MLTETWTTLEYNRIHKIFHFTIRFYDYFVSALPSQGPFDAHLLTGFPNIDCPLDAGHFKLWKHSTPGPVRSPKRNLQWHCTVV